MEKTIYTKEHKFMVQQLIKARKEKGLSQTEAAKLLKKTQSYISKVEAGQHRVDVFQLKAFAGIYKKSLNYFIR